MLRKLILLYALMGILLGGLAAPPPTTAQDGCAVDPDIQRTRYELNAVLDWSTKVVQVNQTIRYRNNSGDDLTSIVLHSEPHRLSRANVMTFRNAQTEDGQVIEGVTTDKLRFSVPLPESIPAGCDAVVKLV